MVDLGAVTWGLATDEHVEECVAPSNVVASPNNDLGRMLLAGEIDAAIAPGRRRLAPPDRGLSHQPHDPLPYGFESSRKTLETFIRFNVDQGSIPQAVAPADLFVPETLSLG